MAIQVFTLQGTGKPGASGAVNTGKGGFSAQVGAGVNQTIFDWVPVPYDAGIPFNTSAVSGVTALTTAIQNSDELFVLVGYSQGAMVTSAVLEALQSGGLPGYENLIAAVTFGNPMRQPGHTFPNYPDPGGHGIMTAASLLTDTPSWWYDYAIHDDLAACNGTDQENEQDNLGSQWLTNVFMDFCEQFDGSLTFSLFLESIVGIPFDVIPMFLEIAPYLIGTPQTGTYPHGEYDSYVPTLTGSQAGNTYTMIELAINYLNSVGELNS
jgi:hypothetical protein